MRRTLKFRVSGRVIGQARDGFEREGSDDGFLVFDANFAGKELQDLDLSLGQRGEAFRRRDLENQALEANRMIVLNGTRVFEAQDSIEGRSEGGFRKTLVLCLAGTENR